jgi:hypothetical protein
MRLPSISLRDAVTTGGHLPALPWRAAGVTALANGIINGLLGGLIMIVLSPLGDPIPGGTLARRLFAEAGMAAVAIGTCTTAGTVLAAICWHRARWIFPHTITHDHLSRLAAWLAYVAATGWFGTSLASSVHDAALPAMWCFAAILCTPMLFTELPLVMALAWVQSTASARERHHPPLGGTTDREKSVGTKHPQSNGA